MKENQNMKGENALKNMDKLPVSKAVFKNILPSIAVTLMMLIYNYADMFFIGMTRNDYMVSAITLATPIFMMFMAFGSLFGTGGLTLISKDAGEGTGKKGKKVSSFCFWGSVITGVVLLITIILCLAPLAKMLGASGTETIAYTKDYLRIIAIAAPFAVVANTFGILFRSEGKPMIAMVGMLMGNLINIVLDPVFILGFDMGAGGAAVATAIGQIASCLFYIIYILRGHSSFSLSMKDFSGKDGIAKDVFAIGIPAALTTMMMNIYVIIQNMVIAQHGDLAVAAMGVGMKITIIASAISNGVGQGIQPLIGYQVGNRNKTRFKDILKFSTLLSVVISLILSVACFVGIEPIVRVFLSGADAVQMGIDFSRIIIVTVWISGIVNLLSFTIQAMGMAKQATVTSLARNGYVGIITVIIMGLFGNMYLVAWAQLIADVISVIIAFIMLKSSMKKCFDMAEGDSVYESKWERI